MQRCDKVGGNAEHGPVAGAATVQLHAVCRAWVNEAHGHMRCLACIPACIPTCFGPGASEMSRASMRGWAVTSVSSSGSSSGASSLLAAPTCGAPVGGGAAIEARFLREELRKAMNGSGWWRRKESKGLPRHTKTSDTRHTRAIDRMGGCSLVIVESIVSDWQLAI